MAGTVYLRTNHFEVKLEGITFKTKDFEALCKLNFLFSIGEDDTNWDRPPIVGIDVMRHPRDPCIILLFLCFGVGCVILRFGAGEALPAPIHRFLADKRIQFVGFAIPEKRDLFPFQELGLIKKEIDIGYLTAKILKDPKYKRRELAELARKVLGIKRMIGLTDASSFERHEQIKCSICQLFITTLIAMGLRSGANSKKFDYQTKKSSVLKNLNSLQLLAEGWIKLFKSKRRQEDRASVDIGKTEEDVLGHDVVSDRTASPFGNCFFNGDISQDGDSSSGNSPTLTYNMKRYVGDGTDVLDLSNRGAGVELSDGSGTGVVKDRGPGIDGCKRPVKGILKCPSTKLQRCNSTAATAAGDALKRANSKGHNVSFNFV